MRFPTCPTGITIAQVFRKSITPRYKFVLLILALRSTQDHALGMTLMELHQKLTTKWPDFFYEGSDREELVARLHHILFVSEHVKTLEKVTGRSYLDMNHNIPRQVCRDRRDLKAIKAAWERGEKTYNGKKIGGRGQYVWRWGRDDAQEVLEMIEEALRDD
jgi:hypothetical protein